MAISTPTVLTSRFDIANAIPFVLPSPGTINLLAGRLYVLLYGSRRGTYPSLTLATVTGQSGSWTMIAESALFDTSQRRVAGWWYIPAADENGITITVTPPGTAYNHHAGAIHEIGAGFDPAAPIAASATSVVTTAALSITTALGAAPAADALSLSAFYSALQSSVVTPRAAWTELTDNIGTGTATDSGGLETQYRNPGEQTASASVAANTRQWGGIHLSVKAAPSTGPLPPMLMGSWERRRGFLRRL